MTKGPFLAINQCIVLSVQELSTQLCTLGSQPPYHVKLLSVPICLPNCPACCVSSK